ncbi:hypothetical protein [Alloyangia pacifica]|uniref:Uncharacterized protein n=1 Tax=Alloyangia pacifica TaxID=311180 RepID=A0A1I6QIV2_9RHOB|nr:hypothetical protein [Alloyangia pacifica]SDF90805.1 hypothetical protein SAMN04488245_101101 [Alloyangia pacifica]SFS52332.1 hypothetical protein SAMN04488050_102102 [Alloyangia pacifica]
MDHFQHRLELLKRAIREGNRPAASARAVDLADIFAASSDDGSSTPPPALPHLPATLIEERKQ